MDAYRLLLPVVALIAAVVGSKAYIVIATRFRILALPNFRSLHVRPIPRGGGVVLSSLSIAGVALSTINGGIDSALVRALIVGGSVAVVVGFVDDVKQIPVPAKLVLQIALATFVVAVLGAPVELIAMPGILVDAVNVVALVWVMNIYNFMDGVDAMAGSGALFMCVAASLAIAVSPHGLAATDGVVVSAFALIASSTLGFLFFNVPPAKLFMGDAGSFFLGYAFSVLIASTIRSELITAWTWVAIFGYFGGDTTTTTLIRIFVARPWYGQHRSHAYQNLARETGSHGKVVLGVVMYQAVWVLPLVLASALLPAFGPFAALLSVFPVIVWTIVHGPLRSAT